LALDVNRPDLLIGVIGAGAMGRGIAQVAAAGGIRVRLTDAKPGAAQDAVKFIDSMLKRAVEKGTLKADDAAAAVGRIEIVSGPADMKPCHAVIKRS
jgi:3-hydroxybutyryl-CoA dehydrogenase